ncbi:hypothetical protein OAE59_00125 [Synechococcus sp. AH-551-B05]|nr:hypothetical protein [Synechococcus sp. AH-551-B05]
MDAHCRTLLACSIRRKQLQQGQHLTKTCKALVTPFSRAAGVGGD